MTFEESRTLTEKQDYVLFAGSKYRVACHYPEGSGFHKLFIGIYDEPPSFHIDNVKIENCELVKEDSERPPKTCFGVKCMQQGCCNWASHKIAEVNIWDKNDIDEVYNFREFQKQHPLTTYLCTKHFQYIMSRFPAYSIKESGVDTRFGDLEI